MRLYSETFYAKAPDPKDQDLSPQAEPSLPTLVFVHGLLGAGRDWLQVVNQLSGKYPCLTVDLPGHGHSRLVQTEDRDQQGFAQASQWLTETLSARGVTRYILIGYSLGARVAMYHACHQDVEQKAKLVGLVLEGGHFGLPQSERAARLDNDQRWAQRFASQPIVDVLADWYRQPVFSSLNHDQRQGLIAKRSDNLGVSIAHMLLATSLAKQPLLQSQLTGLTIPVHYLCGEQDQKFTRLAEGSGLSYQIIEGAGHNVHAEQPYAFARAVDNFILSRLF
ncbi:2-succinyl-6-hydroxy-2,4-cyclohexadiene-1-carboxylate synthase [Photobacterium lutimaris]|uniref:Putative 2-succinyl-6-hydroxy-2,4-cyclohexadiene-1-carboxylate synthase n=1 Tax=Photobacterium lutimaris TaxID=388278 RepID=A0A2T3IXH2_9GAMM|nr:2-succinyl-6-hydroxy-2,4-cyclohexadiene-1-carboxylate synthase [Photobacterium lutimaris]PSU33221.1 2-succinyl-6-hydroxy-2,4-cyclohexadiene-1-carboxylate synthase [Photobacterium lutimaris]TDR75197.1 2-succinyl-6-hydroxy-2,4-cyclohexadiene-1-carboxylate synthase [Photobacterium lutimaris]